MAARIEAAPGADAMLRALGLDHPDRWESFAAGEEVNRSSRGFVRRFRWPEPDGAVFYFKLYRFGRAWKKLLSAFRTDPARREHDNLKWLRARGFPAVEPVAWGSERIARVVRRCFLVTRGEPGASKIDGASSAADRRAGIAILGRLVRRMHDAGFFAHDLHLRNVLVHRTPGAEPRFTLLDFPSGRVLPPGDARRRPAAVHDLATLDRTSVHGLSRADRRRFLKAYCGGEPVDDAFIRAIEDRRLRLLARHERARRRRTPG